MLENIFAFAICLLISVPLSSIYGPRIAPAIYRKTREDASSFFTLLFIFVVLIALSAIEAWLRNATTFTLLSIAAGLIFGTLCSFSNYDDE